MTGISQRSPQWRLRLHRLLFPSRGETINSLGYLQVGMAALFLAFAGPAVATEKRVALAIGNATYAHSNVLKTPSNDAKLVAMTLRTIGFTEVFEHHDLDRAAFEGALDRFAAQARTADWVLIYYAGHA